MTKTFFLLLVLASVLSGCEFNCSVGKTDNGTTTKTVSSQDGGGLTGAVIKNDIELEASDVKVSRAYLSVDNGTPLDSNVVDLKQKISCTVVADTGWTKIDGKTFIGTSERVTGSDGTVLLDAKDLFVEYDSTGLSAEDAKVITISATVSSKIPGVDMYKVEFKIWDKKANGMITGKFKFRVR
jgi:hypothetical protein